MIVALILSLLSLTAPVPEKGICPHCVVEAR